MNSGKSKPFIDRTKTGEYILTGLLAVLVLATVLFPIRDLDQITKLGNEIQYWGGAMSILGQDWSKYMNGQAMVSYGYSLILLPICMLFQNATFAYKAAIILNGCIWMLAYLFSVRAGKKLLRNVNAYVSIVGCFLICLLPIYGESRILIGPQALMILLFWICVDLVLGLQNGMQKKRFITLGVCLILLAWLDVTMAAVFAGTGIYLYSFVQKKQLEEQRFLGWILFVLVGITVGYFAEQVFLSNIFADVSYSGSVQVLIDKMIANWTNEGFFGLIYGLIGKLFAVSVNTVCLIIPAAYAVIKSFRKSKGEQQKEWNAEVYVVLVFAAVFLLNVLCWMGVSSAQIQETLSLGSISVVVGPIVLIGVGKLFVSEAWIEESIAYVVGAILMVFVTSHMFKDVTSIAVDALYGVFNHAFQSTGTAQGMLYYSVVLALVVFLIGYALIKVKSPWQKLNRIAVAVGVMIMAVASFTYALMMTNSMEETQDKYTKYQPMADVLNSIDEEVYCLESDGALKGDLPILQMLTNKNNLILLDNEEADEKKDNVVLLTSGNYSSWEEELSEHNVNCHMNNLVIWSPEDSAVQAEIDAFLETKEYKASRKKGGRNSVYGENLWLSPGTYKANFYVTVDDAEDKEKVATLTVKTTDGTLQTKTLRVAEIEIGKETVVELPFTSEEVFENITFNVKKEKGVDVDIDKVTYQKVSSDYQVGVNNAEDLEEIVSVIETLNDQAGKEGEVTYLEEKNLKGIDYVIASAKLSDCYDLLNTHSILLRNDSYTLLSPTKGVFTQKMKQNQGFIGSVKNSIDIKTFLKADDKGNYDYADEFSLGAGDYTHVLKLKLVANEKSRSKVGNIFMLDGSKKQGFQSFYAKQFDENGIAEVSVPFVSLKDIDEFRYDVRLYDGVEVEVLDIQIKMNSARYAVGCEEKGLKDFAEIIHNSDESARVSYYTNQWDRKNEQYSLDYLKSILPECTVTANTKKELMDDQGDRFIITRGHSSTYFELVSKYTIIGQEGQYLLWARSDGNYLVEAMEQGVTMYSQGTRISAEGLAKIQGEEFDGTIASLPKGNYRIYMDVQVTDVVEGDTIEVGLSRDKTDEELKIEQESYQLMGYNVEEIEQLLEKVYYTNRRMYTYRNILRGKVVVSIDINCPSGSKNIRSSVSSWLGSDARGIITWIEVK